MPNKPSPFKCIVGVRLDREINEKLSILARQLSCTKSDLVARWIFENTQHIILSAHDYEKIAQDIRKASKK